MRLIQVYHTRNDQNYNAGFTDRDEMLDFLKVSIVKL